MFYTTGNQDIVETTWDKPEPSDDEIEVKSIYTGVCRSDIDMYAGKFTLPSIYMQGHEGLGEVTKVGKNICDIEVGNFVATRGEPAFADYYNAHRDSVVSLGYLYPEERPPKVDYIIEPVACGVNLVAESLGLKRFEPRDIDFSFGMGKARYATDEKSKPRNILILGTGFLARVVYATLIYNHNDLDITVVGRANQDFWIASSVKYLTHIDELKNEERFDIIYDISEKAQYVAPSVHHLKDAGMLIVAAEKKPNVAYPISELLWKSAKVIYPSPRSEHFFEVMCEAVSMVDSQIVDVSDLWTKAYDRETEIKQAFEDGLNRKEGYSRGYIKWTQ